MDLATKFAPYTDELFKAESKITLLTNSDFDWTGAHTVAVWKISTVEMQDYGRNRNSVDNTTDSVSRYGDLIDLSAQTEDMMLTKDRSFIFNIDKMDEDETAQQVSAASALARQLREVVIPEVDTYVLGKMAAGAGNTATPAALTSDTIYDAILKGSEALDDAEVPDTNRVLVVSSSVYRILKYAVGETAYNDVDAEARALGVVSMLDGMQIIKVPSSRLPENFGFMIAHPSATVAPVKLEDYNIHIDTPLSSGSIVTGRVVYDAFVLDNKADGIYYHAVAAASEGSGADDENVGE